MMRAKKSFVIAALFLGAFACGDDSGKMTDGGNGDGGSAQATLELSFDNLPELGPDFVYEGWLVGGGQVVTTGRFTVTNGVLSETSFPVSTDPNGQDFILTIEPNVNDDPDPTDIHIVAGSISNDQATLSSSASQAIGTDFSSASGQFFVATPTTTDTTDENQGIWFIDGSMTPPVAGLTLPELEPGWVYEGWVVDMTDPNAPVPVSTGRFTSPDEADDNQTGEGSDAASPGFPGHDFISPARVLTSNYAAVISVEPEPDDSAAPFFLKPLQGSIADMVGGTNPQNLSRSADASEVTGSISVN